MGFHVAIAKFIGFWFCIGEPSLEVASCPLFDMALCFLIGSDRNLMKWLQKNIETLMMFNKRRRCFHSSRVKLPFGQPVSKLVFGVNTFDLDFLVLK